MTILNSTIKVILASGDEDEGIVVLFGTMGTSNQPSTENLPSDTPVLDNFGMT